MGSDGGKFVSPTHQPRSTQYPKWRVHTYLGFISTKYFYTDLCIKMNHMLTLRGILAIIFYKVCKLTTVESLTSIFVVLCRVIPNGRYSSELNFSAYICEKEDHRFIVIFSEQIKSAYINRVYRQVCFVVHDINIRIYIPICWYVQGVSQVSKSKKYSYPRNRPWRPIGSLGVTNSTLPRQSAQMAVSLSVSRTSRDLLPRNINFLHSGTHFCCRQSTLLGLVRNEGLNWTFIHYKRPRTRDPPAIFIELYP
jgi:hypothetical protein